MSIRITANHAHVFPGHVREDGTPSALLELMDQCGIERCVAFATFHGFLGPQDEDPNAWLAREIKGNDRLLGFGVIDFDRGDLRGQVDRIAELGFSGIKLHPAFQRFVIDGEKPFEVYRRAEELGLFLSFHTGVHWHRIADYNMLRFDEVAYHFKKLRFSMEHLGGYCFFHEGVAVMLNNQHQKDEPRLYAGLTSVFDTNENRAWHLSDERIRELLWQTGENAAIFGLDFPYNGREKIAYAIRHVTDMDIPQSAKEKILGGNLRRLLGMA